MIQCSAYLHERAWAKRRNSYSRDQPGCCSSPSWEIGSTDGLFWVWNWSGFGCASLSPGSCSSRAVQLQLPIPGHQVLSEELWAKQFYSKGKRHSICFFIWHLNVIIMISSFFSAMLRSFWGIFIQRYENEQCLYLLNFTSNAFIYCSCLLKF